MLQHGCSAMTKALFLDRDGVINKDIGYAYKPEDIEFIPGIFDLCRRAIELDYQIIIVTNQSGIARGYYTEADFQALNQWMRARFAEQAIPISAIYHCPHHPDISGDCQCRKPHAGMILQAIEQFALDAHRSVMIGDNLSDMLAASKAGISCRLLLQEPSTEAGASTAIIQTLEQAEPYLL